MVNVSGSVADADDVKDGVRVTLSRQLQRSHRVVGEEVVPRLGLNCRDLPLLSAQAVDAAEHGRCGPECLRCGKRERV